jgi:hypothetical protein
MKSLPSSVLCLLILLLACAAALAAETTWTNAAGQSVTGNWSTGELVRIETPDQYAEALADPQPGATYEVADWLYDTHNLSAESGGDE